MNDLLNIEPEDMAANNAMNKFLLIYRVYNKDHVYRQEYLLFPTLNEMAKRFNRLTNLYKDNIEIVYSCEIDKELILNSYIAQ